MEIFLSTLIPSLSIGLYFGYRLSKINDEKMMRHYDTEKKIFEVEIEELKAKRNLMDLMFEEEIKSVSEELLSVQRLLKEERVKGEEIRRERDVCGKSLSDVRIVCEGLRERIEVIESGDDDGNLNTYLEQLILCQSEMRDIEERYASCFEDLERGNQEKGRLNERIEFLEKELGVTVSTCEDISAKYNGSEIFIQELKDQNSVLVETVNRLEKLNHEYYSTIEVLKNENTDLQSQKYNYENDSLDISDNLDNLKLKVTNFEERVLELENENLSLLDRATSADTEMQLVTQEKIHLRSRLDILESNFEDSKSISLLSEENNQLLDRSKFFEKENHNLKMKIKEKEIIHGDLMDSLINNHKNECDLLSEKLLESHHSLEISELEINDLKEKYKNNTGLIENQSNQIKDNQILIIQLRSKNIELENEKENLRHKQISEMEKYTTDIQNQKNELLEEIDLYKAMMSTMEESHKSEMRNNSSEYTHSMEKMIKDHNHEITIADGKMQLLKLKKKAETDVLKNEYLSKIEKLINSHKGEIELLTQELREVKNTLKSFTIENNSLYDTIEVLSNELLEVKSALDSFESRKIVKHSRGDENSDLLSKIIALENEKQAENENFEKRISSARNEFADTIADIKKKHREEIDLSKFDYNKLEELVISQKLDWRQRFRDIESEKDEEIDLMAEKMNVLENENEKLKDETKRLKYELMEMSDYVRERTQMLYDYQLDIKKLKKEKKISNVELMAITEKLKEKEDMIKSKEIRNAINRQIVHINDIDLEDDTFDKRRTVISELLETETSYVSSLSFITDYYIEPLTIMANVGIEQYLTLEEINSIFINITDLKNKNQSFLNVLKDVFANWKHDSEIGDLFLNFVEDFRDCYSVYLQEFHSSQEARVHVRKKNDAFETYQFLLRQFPEFKTFILDDLMITPVQRIPRYEMLLMNLDRATPDDHPDKRAVQKAKQSIIDLNIYLNENNRSSEELHKLDTNITGFGQKLAAPGRTFIFQDKGFVFLKERITSSTIIFCSDLILICSLRNTKLKIAKKRTGDTEKLKIKTYFEITPDTSFTAVVINTYEAILIKKPKEELIIASDNPVQIEQWIEKIKKHFHFEE